MSKVRRKVTVEEDNSIRNGQALKLVKGDNDRSTIIVEKPSVFERLGNTRDQQVQRPAGDSYTHGTCKFWSKFGQCRYGSSCIFPHVDPQGRTKSNVAISSNEKAPRVSRWDTDQQGPAMSPKKSSKHPRKEGDPKTVRSTVVKRGKANGSDSDSPAESAPLDNVDEQRLVQRRLELEKALQLCGDDDTAERLAIGKRILGGQYDSSSAGHTPDTSSQHPGSPNPSSTAGKKQKLKKEKKKKNKLKALLGGGATSKKASSSMKEAQPDKISFKVDDNMKHRKLSSPKLAMFKEASPDSSQENDETTSAKNAPQTFPVLSPKHKAKKQKTKSESPIPVKAKRTESVESRRTSSKTKHKKKSAKHAASTSSSESSDSEEEKRRAKKSGKKKKEKKRRRESTDDGPVQKKKKKKATMSDSSDDDDDDDVDEEEERGKKKKKKR